MSAAEERILEAFRARLSQDNDVPAEIRALFDASEWPKPAELRTKIAKALATKPQKDDGKG